MMPVTYSRPAAFPQPQTRHTSASSLPAGLTNAPVALSQSKGTAAETGGDAPLHEAFNDFVGQTFYGQMLQSLRKSVGNKSSRFHGGRGEEVFTRQLDQVLAQKLAKSSGDKLSGSMYRLFTARRK
jgi:Rod binding domain-containing protein